jgi:hypothetical protein
MIGPNTQIKVLLPAKFIPNGATVSKVSGTKPYVLSRGLKLYTNGTESQTRDVVPAANTVFLLDAERCESINQLGAETVLSWHTTPEELWLRTKVDEAK